MSLKKSSKYLFIAIALCLSAGCASSTAQLAQPIRLNPQADLMVPCDSLPALNESNPVSMGDLTEYVVTIAHAYGDCASRLSELQKWNIQNK